MSERNQDSRNMCSGRPESGSDTKTSGTSRRAVLSGIGGAGMAGLAGCVGGGSDDALNISVFGGEFKDVLDAELFEPFAEESGIEVRTEAQGGTAEVLPTIEGAVSSGEAPVDVLILTVPGVVRGANADLWKRWDPDEIGNLDTIQDDLLQYDDNGQLMSVVGMGWFINLVHNTDELDEGPTSWDMLWDSDYEDQLGIMTPAVTGYLPDIAAATRFDEGQDMLETEDGIREVFDELSDITPQGALWYTNEANFQSRLATGEIPAGMLYHDITRVLQVEQDAPVESTFAEEGSIFETGEWAVPRTTEKEDEVLEFLEYSSDPEVQDHVAEMLFTVPAAEEQYSDLSEEAWEISAGPGVDEAIHPTFDMYVEEEQLVNELWDEMIGQEANE